MKGLILIFTLALLIPTAALAQSTAFNFQGLNFLNCLRPISFSWKQTGQREIGFGADDVAKINPLFVTYNQKGEVEGVKYDRLSVVFVNVFKEQQTQIEAQQRQIDALTRLVCSQNPQAEICKKN